MFDVRSAIKESGLSRKEIDKLKKMIKKEFPDDRMMYELHMIRALKRKRLLKN